jgi:hypothetical protein
LIYHPEIICTIEGYILARRSGQSMEDIQSGYHLSEATAYCWEIGYQCYLKKVSLDEVLADVQKYY